MASPTGGEVSQVNPSFPSSRQLGGGDVWAVPRQIPHQHDFYATALVMKLRGRNNNLDCAKCHRYGVVKTPMKLGLPAVFLLFGSTYSKFHE